MKCPKCGGSTAIYGTRNMADGTVFRYRRCLARRCCLKFRTSEQVLPGEDHYAPVGRAPVAVSGRAAKGGCRRRA
jgi:hypothetical protein